MNEEPTREEVIKFMDDHVLKSMKTYFPESYAVQAYKKAIEYIRQVPKYRKKAKRFKRKYMSLRSKVEKIRSEIAEDMANATKEAKQTQDDIDCGITIGLQMALDAVNKHMAEGEVRNNG